MLELGLKTLLAYFLGSLMGAMLLGQWRGVDIRELGSGNAGGTNAIRTQGVVFGVAVGLFDIFKGWIAAGPLAQWLIPGVGIDAGVDRDWLAASCAAAAIAGHVWPIFHEFRGGKGGATLLGTLVALAPMTVPVVLAAWLLMMLASGFVGLATMIAAASAPLATAWQYPQAPAALYLLGICMALFVAWAHRSNIGRMRTGREPRVHGLWLLRARGKP